MFSLQGQHASADIMIDSLDNSTISQIHSMINHPAFSEKVVIMPDAHSGKGCVIGFTMPLSDKVIPNIVGVDIYCGMLSFNVGKIKYDFASADKKIRSMVPFGFKQLKEPKINFEKDFPWEMTKEKCKKLVRTLSRDNISLPNYGYDYFLSKCEQIGCKTSTAILSVGTLGGGNHFIEISEDLHGDNWVTIHTGSRNFGKCICEYWQNIATKRFQTEESKSIKQKIEQIKEVYTGKDIEKKIKELKGKKRVYPTGMEWLTFEDGSAYGYLFDMILCQTYASMNRECIKRGICEALNCEIHDQIETAHNFIDTDSNPVMIRKGAIRSFKNERVIIPFNMRDGILICEGESNPDWNYSAPHGAGRIKSRKQAKKDIKLEKFQKQMKGIFSTSVNKSTLDEAPDNYKPPETIEECIKPTVKILNRLLPIHNLKDS